MESIRFMDVTKTFGAVKAVNGLNLRVDEGEVFALLGHNGAGKTTTLRLLLGLLTPDRGTVTVFGKDPVSEGDFVRGMCGVLSEDAGLYEPLTVYDNLLYYADIYGISRGESSVLIDEMLERFGLSDKKYLVVKGFSTGMKKKVALIRAMLHRPRILLLDEPTNGLDPVITSELRNMLLWLAKERKTTIIMTTHNLDEVQKMCGRICIFRHGKDVFTSSIQELEANARYTENGQFSLERLYMDIESNKANGVLK